MTHLHGSSPVGPAGGGAAGVTIPVLLLRRDGVGRDLLAPLYQDARFEVFETDQLTPALVAFAHRVGALMLCAANDPLAQLVYAVSAGISTPIVVGVPYRLRGGRSAILDAGGTACFVLPMAADDLDALVEVLLPHHTTTHFDHKLRLLLDPISRTVSYAGRQTTLSPREFALLYGLSRRQGPVSTTDVFTYVWGGACAAEKAQEVVAVYVCQLRRKLARLGLRGAIRTVRGYGYVISAESA